MKVAVSASGRDLDSQIDPRFGRCAFFLVVETDEMSFESFSNENMALAGGAGIQSAQFVASKGAKSVNTRGTLNRMKAGLERAPDNQLLLARAISRSLEHYEDEDFLSGKRKVATVVGASDSGFSDNGGAAPDLVKVDGNAIIHFYNDMFQMVITELEREVGAKARDLIKNIIKSTKGYDTTLTQFDLQGNFGNIALQIQEYIKAKGFKPSEQDLVTTLQEVLKQLLLEENRLLGPKATKATVSRLVEKMAGTHPRFKQVVDQLTGIA